MKKLCHKVAYSSLNNGEWRKVKIGRLRYKDIDSILEETVEFNDFDQAFDYLWKNEMAYAQLLISTEKALLYGKYPYKCIKMTKDTFKPFSERYVWKETDYKSIKELYRCLSVSEFIEYCKDHEIRICVSFDGKSTHDWDSSVHTLEEEAQDTTTTPVLFFKYCKDEGMTFVCYIKGKKEEVL